MWPPVGEHRRKPETRLSASCCIVRREVLAFASAGARDMPGERKPGTPAWKSGASEEDDKSMGLKEDEPKDGDRTAG